MPIFRILDDIPDIVFGTDFLITYKVSAHFRGGGGVYLIRVASYFVLATYYIFFSLKISKTNGLLFNHICKMDKCKCNTLVFLGTYLRCQHKLFVLIHRCYLFHSAISVLFDGVISVLFDGVISVLFDGVI